MPGHVLYVEDDDLVRELFAESLREAGFVVQEERLAEQALGALTRERPDLILLDLGMPSGLMSGIDMLVQVRDTPELTEIPVVVLSGLTDVINPDVMTHLNVSSVLPKVTTSGDEVVGVVNDILQGDVGEHKG